MALPTLDFNGLSAEMPIVQGGMGVGISLSGLASAVANQGGVGVIAGAMIGLNEPDIATNGAEANQRALTREIRTARKKITGKGLLGVNIMVALTDFAGLVTTAIKEKVDVIFCGAGLPLDLPKYREEAGQHHTRLVPIVSSGRAADLLCRKWKARFGCVPDGFVVEGPMAGGHLGFKPEQLDDPEFRLENLVADVVEAVKPHRKDMGQPIPVIAAGGVYTGEDIKKFLDLGASGVQMGTRFVATHECDADERFKQAYVDADASDLMVIKSPVGLPGRAVRSRFLDDVDQGKRKPFKCPYQCLKTCDHTKSPYCIGMALVNAQRGKLNHGFAFAGSNAWRTERIMSVAELMGGLAAEYAVASRTVGEELLAKAEELKGRAVALSGEMRAKTQEWRARSRALSEEMWGKAEELMARSAAMSEDMRLKAEDFKLRSATRCEELKAKAEALSEEMHLKAEELKAKAEAMSGEVKARYRAKADELKARAEALAFEVRCSLYGPLGQPDGC